MEVVFYFNYRSFFLENDDNNKNVSALFSILMMQGIY